MAFDLTTLTSLLKKDISDSPKSAGVVGIDIGSSAIKLVQLRDVKGVPTLDTYGEIQLGPYEGIDIGRNTRLTPQKTVEALVDIMREAGATGKDVAFSLSYNASFITTIPIPTLDQEKVGTLVPVEARKYIPISLSKINLDWFPLTVHPAEKTTNVLISAVYKDALERYESIMKGGGLSVVASEIEIFSSIRSVLSPKDTAVAVLDCGASSTRLHIVNNGVVGKTHSVLLSGAELTQALVRALAIEFGNAEELKRGTGILTSTDVRIQKALVTELNRGLRELHTVIRRYEEMEQVHVEKLVLSGSGSLLQGLREYVQDMFSLPVMHADPFAKVAYPAFLEDTLKQAGPAFAVAVGVALRAFQKNQK
jgi:type IV pilus assembly protein PilM